MKRREPGPELRAEVIASLRKAVARPWRAQWAAVAERLERGEPAEVPPFAHPQLSRRFPRAGRVRIEPDGTVVPVRGRRVKPAPGAVGDD